MLRCEYASARLILVEFRFQRESMALCSMTRFMPRLSAVSATLLLVAAIVDVYVLLRRSATVTCAVECWLCLAQPFERY